MTLESLHVINTIRRLSLILCEYLLLFFKLFPSCSIDPIHVMISLNAQFCIQSSHIYRPQRSWGKVMFLQASVILSTGGGSASVHAGIPSLWEQAGIPSPDQAGTPLGAGIPPRADPPEQAPPGSRHPPGAKHAGRYGQCAGGTHPTGMQTCTSCLAYKQCFEMKTKIVSSFRCKTSSNKDWGNTFIKLTSVLTLVPENLKLRDKSF